MNKDAVITYFLNIIKMVKHIWMQHKKFLVFGILFIFAILITQKWRRIYLQNRLPSLNYNTIENTSLERKDISDYFTRILIINNFNAFTISTIKELFQIHNEALDRLIIFHTGDFDKIPTPKKGGIFFIKEFNRKLLLDKLSIKEPETNWVLFYERGFLKQKILFHSSDKRIIIPSRPMPKRGDFEKINLALEKIMSKTRPGVYYFSQHLVSSCACYGEFEFLENLLFDGGFKLRLIVIGDFTDLDIDNFHKERSYRIVGEKSGENISKLVHDWNVDTNRWDFNFIVIKAKERIYIFPLIDGSDYKRWLRFKENSLHTIIEEYLNN